MNIFIEHCNRTQAGNGAPVLSAASRVTTPRIGHELQGSRSDVDLARDVLNDNIGSVAWEGIKKSANRKGRVVISLIDITDDVSDAINDPGDYTWSKTIDLLALLSKRFSIVLSAIEPEEISVESELQTEDKRKYIQPNFNSSPIFDVPSSIDMPYHSEPELHDGQDDSADNDDRLY